MRLCAHAKTQGMARSDASEGAEAAARRAGREPSSMRLISVIGVAPTKKASNSGSSQTSRR